MGLCNERLTSLVNAVEGLIPSAASGDEQAGVRETILHAVEGLESLHQRECIACLQLYYGTPEPPAHLPVQLL